MHYGCFFVSFLRSWLQFAPSMRDKVIWIFDFCVIRPVCVTGHKQAGMFLLEDFQEAPTIWFALWGFPPSCYIYCTYVSVCARGTDFAMFPIDSAPSRTLSTCFAQFSARRSFAWVTIMNLHQTTTTSSSSSSFSRRNFLAHQTHPAPSFRLFAFLHVALELFARKARIYLHWVDVKRQMYHSSFPVTPFRTHTHSKCNIRLSSG